MQPTQITLDLMGSPVVLLSVSSPSTDNSEFLLANDESDDTPNPVLAQNIISPIDAVLGSVTFPNAVVVAVQVERSTVLRL
jgi:hypothetical protein